MLLAGACNGRHQVPMQMSGQAARPALASAKQEQLLPVPEQDRALVDYLLKHNARLQSMLFMRAASGAAVDAADQFPDTTLKVMPIGDFAETAAGKVLGAAGIEQMFPGIGKRSNKREKANHIYAAEDARYLGMQVQMVKALRMQLLQRQRSQELSAIIEVQQKILTDMHAVVDARVAIGSADRSQLLEVELMQYELSQSLQQWQGQRLDAEAGLRNLLSLRLTQTLPAAFNLYELPADADKELLESVLDDRHPALLQALAEQEAALSDQELARLSGHPDYMLGFQYTFVDDEGLAPMANGDDQWAVSIGLSIPLDRGAIAARRQAASLKVQQQEWHTRDTRQRVQQEFDSAWAIYVSAQRRWQYSVNDILPRSRERFNLLKAGYESGKASYIEVMDSWRQVLKAEIQERSYYFMQLSQQYQLLSQAGLLFWPEQDKEAGHE